MKELSDLDLRDDVRYAKDHEWIRGEEGEMRIGISDYAQDQLGDIVFVELPRVGDSIDKGAPFGTIESVKAVAEVYMPVGGEILAVNTALEASPELLNEAPYEDGWLIRIRPTAAAELDALMTKETYLEMLKGLA